MSTQENIATQTSALCVGATAFMLGDPSGGTLLATPLAALAAIGATLKLSCAKSAETKAQKRTLKALEDSPEFAPHLDEISQALSNLPEITKLDRAAVLQRAKENDLETAICDSLLDCMGVAQSPIAHLYRSLLQAGIEAANDDAELKTHLTFELVLEAARTNDIQLQKLDEVLAGQRRTKDEVAKLQATVDKLVAKEGDSARAFGIKEGLLISIARKYAEGNPDDFDSALAGVERALEVAAEEQTKGALPSNTDAAVQAILARVDALNDQGAVDQGTAELRRAMAEQAEEIAKMQSVQLRLFAKGIAQAIVARDVDLAVEMELARLQVENGGFTDLTLRQMEWRDRGLRESLSFDLEVAILLGHALLEQAASRPEYEAAHVLLAEAQSNLASLTGDGELFRETTRVLFNGLQHYRETSDVSQNRVILETKLAETLFELGVSSRDPADLQRAIKAFGEVIETCDQFSLIEEKGEALFGRAAAYTKLGEREDNADTIQLAVDDLLELLEIAPESQGHNTRSRVQDALGNAYLAQSQVNDDVDTLNLAIDAYMAAIKDLDEAAYPAFAASTRNNLASALAALGTITEHAKWFEFALRNFELVLEHQDPAGTPLDWAITQFNMSLTLLGRHSCSMERLCLVEARSHAKSAEGKFKELENEYYLNEVHKILADIQSRLNAC